MVTLTGTFTRLDGSPASGTVRVTPSRSPIMDSDGKIVISGPQTFPLDKDGKLTFQIPASNDPDLGPAFTYTFEALLSHKPWKISKVWIPHGSTTVDLSEIGDYTPLPGEPTRTVTIPADGEDGQVLVWDGGGFSWDYTVEEFQRIHDAFMADVNGALTALNDSAVSDLVDDDTSLLSQTLYRVFADRESLYRVAIDVAEFGAIAGSEDSTEHIQAALDYARDNNISRVFVRGTHNIKAHDEEGSPTRAMYYYGGIAVHSGITLDLQDAVLQAIPNDHPNYNIMRIEDAENVKILGGVVLGERHDHTGTSGTHGFGLNIRGSKNIVIEGTEFRDCWGDGIYVAGEPDHHNTNVTIRNVISDGNRRQGMSIIGGDGVHVYDSIFTNTGGTDPQAGVDIEPNHVDTVCKNISFTNCEFSNNAGAGLFVMGVNVDGVTATSCVFKGNTANYAEDGQVRVTRGPSRVVFSHCEFKEKLGDSIYDLDIQSQYAVVENCDIERGVNIRGPYEDTSRIVYVRNNNIGVFPNIDGYGVSTVHIADNTFHDVRDSSRIFGMSGGLFMVTGNHIQANGKTVLTLPNSADRQGTFIFTGNTVENYGEYGVSSGIEDGSVKIVGNTFIEGESSSVAAVYVRSQSENVLVSGNTHISLGGHLLRTTGELRNVQVRGNVSPQLMTGSPSSISTNVWIEVTPQQWWHDGSTITLGS